jgi:NAD(P)-dependent dehydrogenase (short-subunit alcohol dehydrogenase family)
MGWLGSRPGWSADDVPDQTGRVVLVTGANSGIGLEAAVVLAAHGAETILACRDPGRGTAAAERVRQKATGKVHLLALDLADLSSVRAAAAEVGEKFSSLHLLINNAGVMAVPQQKTHDGFEMQLGTNHLGHYALTALLIGRLRDSGTNERPSRVISVSSTAHRMGSVRFDDLQRERAYERWSAYGQSKLANLLFMQELQRRLAAAGWPVIAAACHPGYAATNLQYVASKQTGSSLEEGVMRLGEGLFAQTSAQGALPTLRAATDPGVVGGDYYGPNGWFELVGAPVKVGKTAAAADVAVAARLWDVSAELTGTNFAGL